MLGDLGGKNETTFSLEPGARVAKHVALFLLGEIALCLWEVPLIWSKFKMRQKRCSGLWDRWDSGLWVWGQADVSMLWGSEGIEMRVTALLCLSRSLMAADGAKMHGRELRSAIPALCLHFALRDGARAQCDLHMGSRAEPDPEVSQPPRSLRLKKQGLGSLLARC